ncbi:fumarylacetoacetate hydrolase family protein [Rhodothermus profundi]|uniref:2-keto-4-pentenoate hydratase/2-oxohepta-3-ene-1,7-dioic acid hydratase (Catechol pathway) n=1 Tax=Rhodothermus profundi TaxID=633813 RepID=A0A1M6XGK6_9BACT|nr:fumarylacetoacetate hydrolase family protein [Rhodothermus profundi]SHL05097.1 2-keto-4-pentenoate hydratase/2-oxohepta-3-ene-1,7-dioic acid hydratase (catechol pathway) [Rhodothermus profundi]
MEIVLPDSGLRLVPRKIICVGKNYARHAAELNSTVPEEPILFLKPPTALIGSGGTVLLPPQSREVHHEVELVVVIGREGKRIAEEEALDYVAGYALGLDMTARDLQQKAKEAGYPWTVSKGFDTFAPLGPLVSASAVSDPQQVRLRLKVNGVVRQDGTTADMVFSVAQLIAYCSKIFTLQPGDLLFTGTPEGVGPVHEGDVLEAESDVLPPLRVDVQRA